MGFATLTEFVLHLDERRVEMSQVKVVKTERWLHLIGTIRQETEALASENPQIVFKTRQKQEREAIIRLLAREGQILAFEKDALIGVVVWDDRTNARKLPDFMRKLLGVSP